jgi:hypothetical protein
MQNKAKILPFQSKIKGLPKNKAKSNPFFLWVATSSEQLVGAFYETNPKRQAQPVVPASEPGSSLSKQSQFAPCAAKNHNCLHKNSFAVPIYRDA